MPSEKTSGRHTPKGTSRGVKGGRSDSRPPSGEAQGSKGAVDSSRPPSYVNSGRYTPPAPHVNGPSESPWWVAPVMFGLFILGLMTIVLNLTEILPGAPDNWYTLGGLVLILSGFVAATRLR